MEAPPQNPPFRIDIAPDQARQLAGELMLQDRFAEAATLWRGLLKAWPGNPLAMHALAICLLEDKRGAEALPLLDQAAAAHRDELVALAANRARALADTSRAEEALVLLDNILRTYPQHLPSYYNRGLVRLQLGQHEAAIADLDHVLEHEPGNDNARFGRGFARLVLGDYERGFADYECRLRDVIEEPTAPQWTGEQEVAGKAILVMSEQGLGDNIMFARYLPLLVARGAKVIVAVTEGVKPLLEHLKGVEVIDEDGRPGCDYWVRFMSLAHCFGTRVDTVPPPLELDKSTPVFRQPGETFKVGLCWAGSPHSRYDEHRSIPLEQLRPLFDLPNTTFVSLQKEIRDSDRAAFEEFKARGLVDLAPTLTNFRATAHAMRHLDAMVTVDTSVAHLAGTVGIPTYVLLTAFRTYWLWIAQRRDSPWYPSISCIRQPRDGDWASVVHAAKAGLQIMSQGKHNEAPIARAA